MKKILPVLSLLSVLVVSCYEEIIIPVGDEDPVVVMNAQLNTGNFSTGQNHAISFARP